MIADAPLEQASKVTGLAEKVQAFIQRAKEEAKDGLSFAELGGLTYALMRLVILEVDSLSVPGALKKADVLAAAGMLFDTLADKCIPLAAWPVWWIARPVVRSMILALLSGLMEGVLPDVRAAS